MRTMIVSNLYMYIDVSCAYIRVSVCAFLYIHTPTHACVQEHDLLARVIISVIREIKQIIINYYRD